MGEPQILDLTDALPQTVKIVLGGRTVETSTDVPPIVIAQAHKWLLDYVAQANDPSLPLDVEAGWDIAKAICHEDMHTIGIRGLCQLLSFFRDKSWERIRTPLSNSPSESVENSTEESLSENSLEAPVS